MIMAPSAAHGQSSSSSSAAAAAAAPALVLLVDPPLHLRRHLSPAAPLSVHVALPSHRDASRASQHDAGLACVLFLPFGMVSGSDAVRSMLSSLLSLSLPLSLHFFTLYFFAFSFGAIRFGVVSRSSRTLRLGRKLKARARGTFSNLATRTKRLYRGTAL